MIYVESLQKREGLEISQEPANRVVMRRLEHIYFKVRTQIVDSNSFSS